MTRTITWKKGMRLSADIFKAADELVADAIGQSVLVGSKGLYGLYPARKPFSISLNITNNVVEVVSLHCNGITKNGYLVAVDFDSNYANTFDNRIIIPQDSIDEEYYLVIRLHPHEMREVNEMLSEAKYTFELVGINSVLDGDCLPIASIVNQYGWRMNEGDFVPPCISINAHDKYQDLWRRACEVIGGIRQRCSNGRQCLAKTVLNAVWQQSSSAYIRLEKEKDTLSPAELLSIVQSYISTFAIACAVDEYVSLENAEPFEAYAMLPYSQKDMYAMIEKGVSLCAEISVKMEVIVSMVDETPVKPEPSVQRHQKDIESEEERRRRRWSGIEV